MANQAIIALAIKLYEQQVSEDSLAWELLPPDEQRSWLDQACAVVAAMRTSANSIAG